MGSCRTARLAASIAAVAGGVVAFGSVAEAGALATLHATPRNAAAGSTITVRGTNYSSNPGSSNITLHLDSRSGPPIATFTPRSWLADVPVTVPPGTAPGVHTIVALQTTPAGILVSGLPGRATVVITAAGRSAPGGLSPTSSPTGPSRAVVVTGAGLLLLGAGMTATRSRRALGRPTAALAG